jgi:hypothetical protein
MKVKLQQQKEMFQSHKDMKVSSRNKAPLGNSESSFECESSGQIQLVEDIKRALQMGGNQGSVHLVTTLKHKMHSLLKLRVVKAVKPSTVKFLSPRMLRR